jgi:methyl-accepting chemotaxis protein
MRTRRHAIAWAVWGALVGAAFPLAGVVVEAVRHPGNGLGAAALLRAAGAPLFWIICAAPVVLGLLSGLVGQRQDRLVAVEDGRREAFLKTASELFTAAQALLATVSSFSATTAGTAASVRETTATMGQLGHTATQAALTAETVIGLARQGERASAEGRGAVESCVGELRKVADEVGLLARRMEALDGRMHEVFEAAAGVALVAEGAQRLAEVAEAEARAPAPAGARLEEVAAALRKQAEEAGLASSRARGVLAELHDAVRAARTTADGGLRRVEQGADVASSAGEIIQRLAAALRDASRAAQEIAQVAQQQDRGIDQVLGAMNEIYLATQESMASTQAVATEAKALNDLASGLKRSVQG